MFPGDVAAGFAAEVGAATAATNAHQNSGQAAKARDAAEIDAFAGEPNAADCVGHRHVANREMILRVGTKPAALLFRQALSCRRRPDEVRVERPSIGFNEGLFLIALFAAKR
jgi:hypothetical protein